MWKAHVWIVTSPAAAAPLPRPLLCDADETSGCYKVVGAEVVTEQGRLLGRVRDFSFNPDVGQLGSIEYDVLGLPSIPRLLLSCYRVEAGWIKSLGVDRVILYQ